MKIGFIAERMLLGFGVDLVIDQTARGLVKLGHSVTVFPSITDNTYTRDNPGYGIVPLSVPANAVAPRYEYNAYKKADFLNSQDIDLYIVETYPFFMYSFFLKKPVIIVDHGVSCTKGFPMNIRLNFSYVSFMQRYFYFAFAKHIFTVSSFIQKNYPFYLKKKCSVVYNGTDHYKRDPSQVFFDIRKELDIPASSVLMLYVGRLNPDKQPYKGTRELLENFRRIKKIEPSAELLMVGYGDEEDKKYIESYGAKTMIKAPSEHMKSIYSQSDFYISCSKWEGFNLPAAEAQSFGKPVLLYKAGAHPEIVKDGDTGFLVKNPDEFVQKACTLITDESLRGKMAANASRFMGEFTWDKTNIRYNTKLLEVMNK